MGKWQETSFPWSHGKKLFCVVRWQQTHFPWSNDNRLFSTITWQQTIFHDQMRMGYFLWSDDNRRAHDNRFFHGYMTEDYFSWLHNNRRIFHDHVTNAFSMVTLGETGTQVGSSQWLVAALQRPRSNIRHSSLQQWDNSYSSDRNRQILTSLSVGQSLESGENRAC